MALPQDVHQQVLELMARAEKDTIVASAKSVCNILKQHGLMWEMRVHCRHVGVHPCNRDGIGVSAVAVQQLLSNIFALGFDWAEVKALAVETDGAGRDDAVKFNERLVASSSGTLAPISDHLMLLSLQGSHTNQALRAIHYACSHPNQELTENGKLSVARIEAKDRSLADAVKNGCPWQVVSANAVKLYPGLPQLLQTAGNACGQIAQGEHEVQMLHRVFAAWKAEQALLKDGFQVVFNNVKARVSTSVSQHLDTIAPMYSFILKFCGGESGTFLSESVSFINHHGKPTLKLGAPFYQALSTDTKGDALQRLAQVRQSALKLAFSGTEVISKSDVMRLISSSSPARLGQLMASCQSIDPV